MFLLWAVWPFGTMVIVFIMNTCSKWIGIRSTGRHYVFIYQVNNFGMTNKSQTFLPLIFKFRVYRRCGVHVFTLRVKRFEKLLFDEMAFLWLWPQDGQTFQYTCQKCLCQIHWSVNLNEEWLYFVCFMCVYKIFVWLLWPPIYVLG